MNNLDKVPVITIDGPSGTGKGTISLMLANKLGWNYLDSGAIYRVLAYAVTSSGVDLDEIPTIISIAQSLKLEFRVDSGLKCHSYLDGKDISTDIRKEICGNVASKIAAIPDIRAALLERQRGFACLPGLVTDGRDMGTVVFPNASLKIFLNASVEERAKRRYLQLKNVQNDVTVAQVVELLAERDARDSQRSCSPLKPAHDAIQVDTTTQTVNQVFDYVLKLLKIN